MGDQSVPALLWGVLRFQCPSEFSQKIRERGCDLPRGEGGPGFESPSEFGVLACTHLLHRGPKPAQVKVEKNEMIYGLRREKLGSAYEVQLMTKQTALSILLHFYRI
jgi:hypothetical protein